MLSHSLGVALGFLLVGMAIVLMVVSVKLGTTKTIRTLGQPVYRRWGLSNVQTFVLTTLWLLCIAGYVFTLVQNVMRNLEGEGVIGWMVGLIVILACGMIIAIHTVKGGEDLATSAGTNHDPC